MQHFSPHTSTQKTFVTASFVCFALDDVDTLPLAHIDDCCIFSLTNLFLLQDPIHSVFGLQFSCPPVYVSLLAFSFVLLPFIHCQPLTVTLFVVLDAFGTLEDEKMTEHHFFCLPILVLFAFNLAITPLSFCSCCFCVHFQL